MTLQWIRENYRVPAKRGARVAFICCEVCGRREGTIVGSSDQYLRVQMDDSTRSVTLHPTWRITYLESANGVDA